MEPIIQIKNLTKSYGANPVLNNISIDIEPGQVIGYIGPNGAGKSTTIKILIGLLPYFSGDVFIKGIDIRKNPVAVKSIIGYVPEQAELYDALTPKEYFLLMGSLYNLPEKVTEERSNRLLDALDLLSHRNQRINTFSKGMKQKVLIISALIHNPEILLLDEPLSGLDANNVIIVKEFIDKLAKNGKTIFYCSHIMDVVEKVSNRIILIDKGEIVADGTIDELRQLQNKKNLEDIFSGLTTSESIQESISKLLNAFD